MKKKTELREFQRSRIIRYLEHKNNILNRYTYVPSLYNCCKLQLTFFFITNS